MRHIGTSFRRVGTVCAVSAIGVLMAVPAAALANTAWVSNTESVKAPFNSCKDPSYTSIQAALEGPSTTIRLCAGTYKEQLQINREITITGEVGSIIQLPSSPATSTSTCAAGGEQDLVGICANKNEKIKLSDLTFEAYLSEGTCNDELYGINVGGGAELVLLNSKMLGAGAKPVNGCQGGVGVQIGRHHTGQKASATLSGDEISGYQKNGITVDNAGSKATVSNVVVTGAGLAPIAQNGIQVSRGAVAKISGATISKNECDTEAVPSCGGGSYAELEEDAAGVLFYEEGVGSTLVKSHINENDLGVSHITETETTQPQVKINEDVLDGDRYAGVMLGQGYATVSQDEILNGAVGILLLQSWPGQEFGPRGKGVEDTISGMTKHAIEGLSDNSPYDQFGSFTSIDSKISGNPGSVEESIYSNNPRKLKIVTSGDS